MIQGDMEGFTAWVPVEIRCVPLYFQKIRFLKIEFYRSLHSFL
jgi:hypothetical protein